MSGLLVDVRSPAEFATGFHEGAINIEYTQIAELSGRAGLEMSDPITLYCRSGRRSSIALLELQALGFTNVRDIGDFDSAGLILARERQEQNPIATRKSPSAVAESLAKTKSSEVQQAYEQLLAGLQQGPNETMAQ
ncbi:Rhodanese-like domain-containing protein [Xylariales sp. PMI_506]|nr:Rhodanese-like domain-containing protein [Xylariales sp. PMI_506]